MRDLKNVSVGFSVKANVVKLNDELMLVDGMISGETTLGDNKLLMTREQFENAIDEYAAEQEEEGGDVSGYCYFVVSNIEEDAVYISCLNSDEFYVDMCYDVDINAEDDDEWFEDEE
jgi:hypothetical protein